MTDKQKLDLLLVTLMRAEYLVKEGNVEAMGLWWVDAEKAIKETMKNG